MATSLPTLGQLLPSTNIEIFLERLEQYFICKEVKDEAKVATLITSFGEEAYITLRSLCQPVQVAQKSYADLKKLLTTHFAPKPSELAARFRFPTTNSASRRELHGIHRGAPGSLTATFGESLNKRLRDQLVFGLRSDAFRAKLLEVVEPTSNPCKKKAMSLESAERSSLEMSQRATESVANLQFSTKQAKLHMLQEERMAPTVEGACNTQVPIFAVRPTGRNAGPTVMLLVNGQECQFVIDTGSALQLAPSAAVLRTFTNERFHPRGQATVCVQHNAQQLKLPLLVVDKGDMALLGRDWLAHLGLDWPTIMAQVHAVCSLARRLRSRLDLLTPSLTSAMQQRQQHQFQQQRPARQFQPGDRVLYRDFSTAARAGESSRWAEGVIVNAGTRNCTVDSGRGVQARHADQLLAAPAGLAESNSSTTPAEDCAAPDAGGTPASPQADTADSANEAPRRYPTRTHQCGNPGAAEDQADQSSDPHGLYETAHLKKLLLLDEQVGSGCCRVVLLAAFCAAVCLRCHRQMITRPGFFGHGRRSESEQRQGGGEQRQAVAGEQQAAEQDAVPRVNRQRHRLVQHPPDAAGPVQHQQHHDKHGGQLEPQRGSWCRLHARASRCQVRGNATIQGGSGTSDRMSVQVGPLADDLALRKTTRRQEVAQHQQRLDLRWSQGVAWCSRRAHPSRVSQCLCACQLRNHLLALACQACQTTSGPAATRTRAPLPPGTAASVPGGRSASASFAQITTPRNSNIELYNCLKQLKYCPEPIKARVVTGDVKPSSLTKTSTASTPAPIPKPTPTKIPITSTAGKTVKPTKTFEAEASSSPEKWIGLAIGLSVGVIGFSCLAIWWLCFEGTKKPSKFRDEDLRKQMLDNAAEQATVEQESDEQPQAQSSAAVGVRVTNSAQNAADILG
uniref:Peptidase A2 domain-containing protein n=1 Tax=Macrostomum lignano TaxID=282301 RepID=A0A1I8F4Z9_9PLAT